MNLGEWLRHGIDAGYCTNPSCNTHDGPEMTEDELEQFDDGYDPCVHIVRLWPVD